MVMKKGSCSTPSAPRNPLKGGMASVYEAPVRTSGSPKMTKSSGTARMVNVSEVKPGAGTGGDGQKVRRVK